MTSVISVFHGWTSLRSYVHRILIAGCLTLLAGSICAADVPSWSTGGSPFEGRLSQVYGSHALIVGKKQNALLSLQTFTDDELRRVASFLATQTAKPVWGTSSSKVTRTLLKKLEVLQDGKLVTYDPSAKPEPEIYLIYFSAGWCGPCHRFTPKLVEAYRRMQETSAGRVEVIFVSRDENARDQANYARSSGMPWPMLKYSSLGHTDIIEQWEGNGIPCLVAVTRNGELIFHSYRGQEYLGPQHVLDACDQLLPAMVENSNEVRRLRHRLAVIQHLIPVNDGDCPPKAYLVGIDIARYGTIEIPPVTFTLSIDERGNVTDAAINEAINPRIEALLLRDAWKWLFLPAVKNGKPCPQKVQVPLLAQKS